MNDRQTELFNKTGTFFAFGQEQFEDQKKEGVKYVSLGGGLICPKDKVEELEKGLEHIVAYAVRRDVKENGVDRIIEREYFNYETQITTDPTEAISALADHIKMYPELFTRERINKVMNTCYTLAVDQDYF